MQLADAQKSLIACRDAGFPADALGFPTVEVFDGRDGRLHMKQHQLPGSGLLNADEPNWRSVTFLELAGQECACIRPGTVGDGSIIKLLQTVAHGLIVAVQPACAKLDAETVWAAKALSDARGGAETVRGWLEGSDPPFGLPPEHVPQLRLCLDWVMGEIAAVRRRAAAVLADPAHRENVVELCAAMVRRGAHLELGRLQEYEHGEGSGAPTTRTDRLRRALVEVAALLPPGSDSSQWLQRLIGAGTAPEPLESVIAGLLGQVRLETLEQLPRRSLLPFDDEIQDLHAWLERNWRMELERRLARLRETVEAYRPEGVSFLVGPVPLAVRRIHHYRDRSLLLNEVLAVFSGDAGGYAIVPEAVAEFLSGHMPPGCATPLDSPLDDETLHATAVLHDLDAGTALADLGEALHAARLLVG